MDAIEILSAGGDRIDPARIRISHEQRVLDVGTVLAVSVIPQNKQRFAYPTAEILESPPVKCYLYDWLQYINYKLSLELGNITTSKEQQLADVVTFDVFPIRQAEYCFVESAEWIPEYTDEPAQTELLYAYLDNLIKLPSPTIPYEEIISVTVRRITSNGDVRVTSIGDTRVGVL